MKEDQKRQKQAKKPKKSPKTKVDPDTLIVEDVLQQIMPPKTLKNDLESVYVYTYPKQESPQVVKILNEKYPLAAEKTSLAHLRRFRKHGDHVQCIVGTVNPENTFQKSQISQISVPKWPPQSKNEAMEQSKIWPVKWNGDPNIQQLTHETFDVDFIEKMLTEIAELAAEIAHTKSEPIVTRIVSQTRVIATASDKRYCSFLHHSVPECLEKVACERKRAASAASASSAAKNPTETTKTTKSTENTNEYLCLGYDVFTTHEPCTYCTMALVHSRINRLFYIKTSARNGAIEPSSGQGFCIHQCRELNWSFNSFKWVGKELHCPEAKVT